jgi:hypothetical protein
MASALFQQMQRLWSATIAGKKQEQSVLLNWAMDMTVAVARGWLHPWVGTRLSRGDVHCIRRQNF